MSAPVIAAIDLGPLTGRVLFHAAAFARLLQVPLRVLHVNGEATPSLRERVLNACLQLGPYQTDFDDSQIVIRPGPVSEAIAREALRNQATLIVIGSRGTGGVTRLLLGSTSESVLRNATAPVLVVPPIDIDIVNIGDSVQLTCGPIMAAIDLSENSSQQLRLAAKVAEIGRQPLLLMTVAKSRVTDHEASEALRERAHALPASKPRALIVRRGSVVEEISRCALTEGAGLVVMGLRSSPRGQPGVIASAVLRTRRAFVHAVSNANTVRVPRVAAARPALIATMLMLMLVAGAGAAQRLWGDVAAVTAFQRAADAYAFLHRQAERQLGLSHRAAGHPQAAIGRDELAAAIRAAVADKGGTLFTPAVVVEFRAQAARAVNSGCDAGELRTGVWDLLHTAYTPATATAAVSECIVRALPPLPPELEYRSAGTVLLVVDTHADLVVDVLPALLAGSELR